jgi:hypothetical protein
MESTSLDAQVVLGNIGYAPIRETRCREVAIRPHNTLRRKLLATPSDTLHAVARTEGTDA